MVRVIPVSDDKVAALLRSGRTANELAEEWGVKPGTVRKAARAVGWGPGTNADIFLPVRDIGPRAYAPAARNLRALERLKERGSLPEPDQKRLDNWKAERNAKPKTVVEYADDAPANPASPTYGGWYYAPRRPETPADEYYQERSPDTPPGEFFQELTQG